MPRIFACFLLIILLVACSHNPKGSAKNTNNKTSTKTSTTKNSQKLSSVTTNSKNTSTKTATNQTGNSSINKSKNSFADNTKQMKKLPKKIADFPVNQIATYYKVPFTVLKIEKDTKGNAKEDKEFDISKTEDEKAFLIHTITPEELEKDPEKYIENLQVKYQRKSYVNVKLSQEHKTILQNLLSKTDKNSNKLALMFVNGYKLKNYEQQTISVEKTVYAQYITDYLYNLDSKIRVEKRYVTDMPEDEIFIIIVGFDGRVPYNIYNSPKLDSIQWLSRYVDYEYKKNQEIRKGNAELEQVIENTANIPEEVTKVTPDELAEYQEQQTSVGANSTIQSKEIPPENAKASIIESNNANVNSGNVGNTASNTISSNSTVNNSNTNNSSSASNNTTISNNGTSSSNTVSTSNTNTNTAIGGKNNPVSNSNNANINSKVNAVNSGNSITNTVGNNNSTNSTNNQANVSSSTNVSNTNNTSTNENVSNSNNSTVSSSNNNGAVPSNSTN
ncbi:hypothetical protein HAV_00502 [Candidatus Hepatincola sp. Av]